MDAKQLKINFEPFKKQYPATASEAPIVVVVAGARGGKTQLGAFLTAMDAIEQPGYLQKDIDNGEPYVIGIGAPTFPMLNRVILPTVLRYIPDEMKIGRYHQTNKLLRVSGQKGETHIFFISARFWESWYALKLSRAWIDEFALIKEGMFDELQTRLSDVQGRLRLTGTPQGPNWALKRLYEPWRDGMDRWGDGGQVDFFTWTTMDNPYMDKAYIEAKRRTLPKRYFDRTFLATWDTFAGQVWEDYIREIHVQPAESYRFITPQGRSLGVGQNEVILKRVVAGVDWGFGTGHPGVILICGLDNLGRWWIVEESYGESVLVVAEPTVDSWVNRARRLMLKWHADHFYCDPSNPEAIHQFTRAGVKASAAVNAVLPGIETVARYMHVDEVTEEPRLIMLDCCDNLVGEVGFYHWKENAAKEQPEKTNDHCCDALRYGLHTYEVRGTFKREPNYGRKTGVA